jgi:hypothetical protein
MNWAIEKENMGVSYDLPDHAIASSGVMYVTGNYHYPTYCNKDCHDDHGNHNGNNSHACSNN